MIFTVVAVALVVVLPASYVQTLREDFATAQPEATTVSGTVLNSIKQSLSVIVKELPRVVVDIAEKPT